MSTATELLKRALDRIDWVYPSDIKLKDEIRTYLSTPSDDAEEPVAWQDLTDEEISDVLNVDPQWFMDGLNWKALDLLEYARDIERALKEKNAKSFEPVAWNGLTDIDLRECYGNPEALNTKALIDYGNAIEKMLREKNYPPKPAEPVRKPMTEEEMRKGSGEWAHLHNIFEEGIRYAEKHHGIGVDDGQ